MSKTESENKMSKTESENVEVVSRIKRAWHSNGSIELGQVAEVSAKDYEALSNAKQVYKANSPAGKALIKANG